MGMLVLYFLSLAFIHTADYKPDLTSKREKTQLTDDNDGSRDCFSPIREGFRSMRTRLKNSNPYKSTKAGVYNLRDKARKNYGTAKKWTKSEINRARQAFRNRGNQIDTPVSNP